MIIRPSNLYGPYDNFHPKESHVIPSLIRRVVNKETPFKIWGTGEPKREFLYAEDLAEAIKGALKIPRNIAREHALRYSWLEASRLFLKQQIQINK